MHKEPGTTWTRKKYNWDDLSRVPLNSHHMSVHLFGGTQRRLPIPGFFPPSPPSNTVIHLLPRDTAIRYLVITFNEK